MPRGSILLVDDEPKIRAALAGALRDEGHEVIDTESGTEARRLLGQRLFDVMVVDNLMPDLTGLDLIRDLVSTVPESERPQILMMTAHATIESAIEGDEARSPRRASALEVELAGLSRWPRGSSPLTGGALTVTSPPEGPTTFTFDLPLVALADSRTPAGVPATGAVPQDRTLAQD